MPFLQNYGTAVCEKGKNIKGGRRVGTRGTFFFPSNKKGLPPEGSNPIAQKF